MNKVVRVVISVPLAVVVSTLAATLLLLIAAFFTSAISGSKYQRETAFWIAFFVTVLPALLTGAVIPLFNLRPLRGAITGAAAQLLLLILILLLLVRDLSDSVLLTVGWVFIFGTAGAVSGFLCGLMSPHREIEKEKSPTENFNLP